MTGGWFIVVIPTLIQHVLPEASGIKRQNAYTIPSKRISSNLVAVPLILLSIQKETQLKILKKEKTQKTQSTIVSLASNAIQGLNEKGSRVQAKTGSKASALGTFVGCFRSCHLARILAQDHSSQMVYLANQLRHWPHGMFLEVFSENISHSRCVTCVVSFVICCNYVLDFEVFEASNSSHNAQHVSL